MADTDVIVLGAGMVGASIALALADSGINVHLYDAGQQQTLIDVDEPYQMRVSAISEASREWLSSVGVWPAIQAQRVCAYRHMHVWQTPEHALLFNADDIQAANLGHIVENRAIVAALQKSVNEHAHINVHYDQRIHTLEQDEDKPEQGVTIYFESGQRRSAHLLVAADGAQSYTRDLAGIGVHQTDYSQAGLVAVLKTQKPLKATAWQKFLPTGPLAFLPLNEQHCSIVWTLPSDQVAPYLSMDNTSFEQQVSESMEQRFGDVKLCSPVKSFPLIGRHAKQYARGSVVLVGDAAHSIHPMAGQGVNLGFKDARALSRIVRQRKQGEPLNDARILHRYEHERRLDNQLTKSGMEALDQWFAYDNARLNPFKQQALSLFNASPLKNLAMKQAMGL